MVEIIQSPPHRVNYRAKIHALHKPAVERILATNAVGGIASELEPGDVVVTSDFIGFTKLRPTTFYDEAPVTHIDFSEPFCPQLRKLLIEKARGNGLRVWIHGVLACTEGPNFETPAEIEMLRRLGCNVVGTTGGVLIDRCLPGSWKCVMPRSVKYPKELLERKSN